MTSSPVSPEPLLTVRDLSVTFRRGSRLMKAVAGVSFDLQRGQTIGLVGESGSGKTTIGRAILQLLPHGASEVGGSVKLDKEEVTAVSKARMRDLRSRLQMIFQDPLSSFNPRRRVWDIVGEGLEIQGLDKAERERRVEAALLAVGMSREMVEGRRPHQFSGGQCQRIAIARSLALEPDLIVCDEPVASLDVSVQARIINLLQDIRAERNVSLIFISHDLAVVRNVSDWVVVLYMGRIVESGEADRIYTMPAHPYTRMLLDSVPAVDASRKLEPAERTGEVPSQLDVPSGCRFRTRCPRATALCAEVEPELSAAPGGQVVACHFPHDTPYQLQG
ncbi:MAG: ABC transporter ATP-binding protein [Devosia sp.]